MEEKFEVEFRENNVSGAATSGPAFAAAAGKILLAAGTRIIFEKGASLQVGTNATKVIRTEIRGPSAG